MRTTRTTLIQKVSMDSDSDHSCFDYSESDRDEDDDTEMSNRRRVRDISISREFGWTVPVCAREDRESSDCETSDSSDWSDSESVCQSPSPPARVTRGRTRQRNGGQVCQHGAAGDQARTTVNHLNEAPDPDNLVWHETNWQPKILLFTENPGPVSDAAALDSEQPVDFIELFISDVLIQNIVDQTNLYADQYIEAKKHAHERCCTWTPVTVSEMKPFLGLFLLTGIIHKPELDMYWSRDEMLASPYFNKVMPFNRFEMIWRFLHFSDNKARPANDTDRLYKVRPVLDYLVSKFRELYQPNANVCIDDRMLLWCGIKSYVLCDSDTGYCFNIKPCCEESTAQGDTVVSLLDRLVGHGYRLFINNCSNSVQLCERLLALKTNVCGTLTKNRDEPPVIRDADLRTGETIMCHTKNVMMLAWRDKQTVKMITTFHQNNMESIREWQRRHQRKVAKQKPACIVEYSNAVNGVDKLDRNIVQFYPFVKKSQKWTKKFVTYLFEISLFNAFVLYKVKNPQSDCKTLLSFIQSVIKSWTSQDNADDEEERDDPLSQKTPRAPYNTDPKHRLNDNFAAHALVPILPTPKKQHPTRRCRVCIRKGLRKETSYYCKGCGVPLHFGKCYTVYHSKADYSA